MLTKKEKAILENMEVRVKGKFALYWMPCVWIEEVLNHMFKLVLNETMLSLNIL